MRWKFHYVPELAVADHDLTLQMGQWAKPKAIRGPGHFLDNTVLQQCAWNMCLQLSCSITSINHSIIFSKFIETKPKVEL